MPSLLLSASANSNDKCPPNDMPIPEGWVTPFPAYRVIANLYAVGPADLGVFLITTSEGHILINTGIEDSTPLIRENIEKAGFRLEDIKILLVMQSHIDHAAALAEIKEITGAQMLATRRDARVLQDGGASDPHFGECTILRFKPVAIDRVIADGEVIELGTTRLLVHEHPGHTEGSSSYSMTVSEGGRDYNVAIVNMGSINDGKKLVENPTYPGVADDFAETFRKQKAMEVDVWVAAHAGHFRRQEKHTPGQTYSPDTFFDPKGFLAMVEYYESKYLAQVAEEESSVE
ncbi:MAG: subclass B3 metallo-beta-lactamase [Gammaproteobacteria bacterium]|nr:subclass B3 metallo-beta-lactamase [Gammaproteobacteria bacterium]